ncbi:MAG: MBL fold metallo-hydrolase [Hyphomicrobiaceae bacterium]
MSVSLQFCGAAKTVTGSCYWLTTDSCSFLVDCGMFQGTKTVKELNYGEFPFVANEIDFVLLTHAHTDHAGLLPKLYKAGFSGPTYMTRGTRDLLSFMLPDSGYIQEMEVAQLNTRNARRGRPQVQAIYTKKEAQECQTFFRTIEYETWLELPAGIRARYWNAGHILGSASIEIEIPTGRSCLKLLFSGDIGPDHKLFHPDPEASTDYDYLISESTYGGERRVKASPTKRRAFLAREVNDALRGNGILLIPSFAVERTQELLADLSILQFKDDIPRVPIFVDSPMAIRATEVFREHAIELEDLGGSPGLLDNPHLHFTQSSDESRAINRFRSGVIILSASGMCDAGRIRHHLKHNLWRSNATVMIVGHQAEGTLGRLLVDGATAVRIQGEEIQVRARIKQIDAYSGHADGSELVQWVKERQPIHRALFLTHGESYAATAMREDLVKAGLDAKNIRLPELDDCIDLISGRKVIRHQRAPIRLDPKAITALDWHNELAQFQLDLQDAFDKAADKRSRGNLLRRLRRALDTEKTRARPRKE